MKKSVLFLVIMLCIGLGGYAQKLSKEETNKYEAEMKDLLSYLEETLNFLGDSTATAFEKEIVFTESWSKIFIDDKVQIEDDLDMNRNTPINKDVQAYLKDIDFFFKNAQFKFDLQSISNSTREDGSIYFKASLSRHLTAKTINDEAVNDIRSRFVEVNLDRQNSSLKIASIYTTKINEKEALRNWWNSLSQNWKNSLGGDIKLYDSIPLSGVGMITSADFMASYPVVDPITGETTTKDKFFKTEADQKELYAKLKSATQRQSVDISNIREIISVEPLSELSDLTVLNISGTSVDDISPLRNANKLKVLRANSTLISDISPLKYCITLEELEVGNTNIEDLGVLASLRNLQKLDVSNTMANRIIDLKNCAQLNTLNLSSCHISNIAPLQELTQLAVLDISNTMVRDLSPISKIATLRSLNISGTPIVRLDALTDTQNLREFYCSKTNISDLTPLKNNKRLSKVYCDQSQVGDEQASEFTKINPFALVIYDTEALRNWWNGLPIYWKSIFSKQVKINAEPTTEQLHEIINMKELDLSGNHYIQSLMPVSRLTNLKSLNIANTDISFLQALQGLVNLESLNIANTYINDLAPLAETPSLKHLNISNTPVSNLAPLANDNSIEVIIADSTTISSQNVNALKEQQRQVTVVYQTQRLMEWWNSIDDTWKAVFRSHVNFENNIPNALELQQTVDLREIVIGTEFPITTLEPIAGFRWLERLTINNQAIRDIAPLADKTYLLELNAQNNPISSLKPIENNTMLELLNIENTQISDLGPLSRMNNLVTLNAAGTPLKSLKPLQNLMKLENLYVNNTNVKSLSPIENISSLKNLKVYNTKLKAKKIESLQQKRLDLNIVFY